MSPLVDTVAATFGRRSRLLMRSNVKKPAWRLAATIAAVGALFFGLIALFDFQAHDREQIDDVMTLSLAPVCGDRLSGLVMGSDSVPIEGATVMVKSAVFAAERILRTDEFGKFDLYVKLACSPTRSGPVVSVYKTGYQPYVGSPAEDGTVNITLLALVE